MAHQRISADLKVDDGAHPVAVTRGENDESPDERYATAETCTMGDGDEAFPGVDVTVSQWVGDEHGNGELREDFALVMTADAAKALAAQLLRAAFACYQVDPREGMVTVGGGGPAAEA